MFHEMETVFPTVYFISIKYIKNCKHEQHFHRAECIVAGSFEIGKHQTRTASTQSSFDGLF